jgi:hypothetical protein
MTQMVASWRSLTLRSSVRFGRRQRREKPQLRRRKILRLVDDDMIEWLGGPAFKSFREAGENVRPGRIAFRRQRLMDRREYGPQARALIGAKPALAAHSFDGRIGIE